MEVTSQETKNYINSLTGLQKSKAIKEIFMSNDTIPIPENVYGVIYKITDLNNNKIYIGSTKNYLERVSNYVANFLNTDKIPNRDIDKVIYNDDILNFRIEKIGYGQNDIDLRTKEVELIEELDALDPRYGYNTTINRVFYEDSFTESTREKMSKAHIGLKASANTRRKKSKMCVAISIVKGELYLCDSMKLFGEVIVDRTKDIVKNAARSQRELLGFYIFYFDISDLNRQVELLFEYGNSNSCKSDFKILSDYIKNRDWKQLGNLFNIAILRYIDDEPYYELIKVEKNISDDFIIA